MRGRQLLPGVLVLALLGTGASATQAQQSYEQRAEEWNSFQDIRREEDPNQRLRLIDTFLQNYPESRYRPFVYPVYVETAYAVQNYEKTMEVADAFLALDREEVLKAYKQSNPDLDASALDPTYYRFYVLYTFSFLQSFRENLPNADQIALKAAERARTALEMHKRLYAAAQPPQGVSAEQFEQVKNQEEGSFRNVLAFTAWRAKDYSAAAREYDVLVSTTPKDASINYRLGLAHLQKKPADYLHGFWHLARAIALEVPKKNEVKEYLTNSIAAYQQVLPDCIESDVEALIARSTTALHPPADWSLVGAEQVSALRQEMDVKRILEDLAAGGETAHLMWLASCGSEIGSSVEGEPQLAVLVLEVTEAPDNLVTLQVAAGQVAADAKTANMEVKVAGPPEARNLKVEDVVRVSGTISNYQNEPQFLLKLTNGQVNAEDIPKTR